MGKQCNAQTKGKQSETVSLLFQDLLWIGGLHKSDNDNIMVAAEMKNFHTFGYGNLEKKGHEFQITLRI